MSAMTRWISYLANLTVGGSGLVLLWMVFFLKPDDPYAIVHHPAQPFWKTLHILMAPALTLSIGYLWCQHAWSYWRGKVQGGRKSGILLLVSALPMIISGYALQVVIDLHLRTFWSWIHTGTSCLWIAGISVHIIIHQIINRSRQTPV